MGSMRKIKSEAVPPGPTAALEVLYRAEIFRSLLKGQVRQTKQISMYVGHAFTCMFVGRYKCNLHLRMKQQYS